MYGDYLLKDLFFEELFYEFKKPKYDYYVYIPTSNAHYLSRKFDPVKAMFQDICQLTPLLCNVSNTNKNQSRKSRFERLNAESQFVINDSLMINSDSSILLLDDIYTTGRTINFGVKTILNAYPSVELKTFSLVRV